MGGTQGIRAKIRALRRVTTANGATPAEAATAAAKVVELEQKYDLGVSSAAKSARRSTAFGAEKAQRTGPRAAQRTAPATPPRPTPPPKRSRVAGVFWTFVALIVGIAMTPILPGVIVPVAEERGWLSKDAFENKVAMVRETLGTFELSSLVEVELPWLGDGSCTSDNGRPAGAEHQGVPILVRPTDCESGLPTGVFHQGTEIKLRP